MSANPKPGEKWVAVNNSDEVVTVDQVGRKGVSFTYDAKPGAGTSLMVLVGFIKYFRKR